MSIFTNRLFGRTDTGTSTITAGYDGAVSMSRRRADIIKRWAYYHGRDPASGKSQWDYIYERFETMNRRDIEDVENHTRICTDRLRRLLVNSWRGFEFANEESAAVVRNVLERNRWPHMLNLISLYGKVTGDAFIKLAPTAKGSAFGPVRLILLDTEGVEVEVSPHDREEVRNVNVSYDYFTTGEDQSGRSGRHHYSEIIDRESVTAFVDGEYAPEYSYDHNHGFIPVVHVRNRDTGGGIYGESYVAGLTDAQDTINMQASDLMDMVRYDGHKTTIFQNVNIDKSASRDGMTPGEIDLSIGKGLAVKGDGKVYKLDQQHNLGAALQEFDMKLDAFYALAGVPRISHNKTSNLGQMSGRAIERLYQDAIESTREAQCLYGESFRELAEKICLMLGHESAGAQALWNKDVLNADVETLEREYKLGARSIQSVMRKLGIDNVDAMLKERGKAPMWEA